MAWKGLCVLVIVACYAKAQEDPCDDVSCPEGETCNPHLGTCYPDAPTTSRLYVWLGDGPDECDRQPSHCSMFMMDYDISHPYGEEGNWCITGEKVRCVVKDAPPLDQTPDNELRVVSYNIFERQWVASIDGQRERTCRIPHIMAANYPNIDVMILQECFMGGCWPNQVSLRDLLTLVGYLHQTRTITSSNKVSNGGIFIASRWPILEEDDYVFESSDKTTWDHFAAKGVSYAKILKGSMVYHVMGTHLQAGRKGDKIDAKVNQSIEWGEYIRSMNIPFTEPLIFGGDFNANYYEGPSEPEGMFDKIMTNLGAVVPPLVGPVNASSNPLVNDILQLKGKDGWGRWIDHVAYSHQHLEPRFSTAEILVPEDGTSFPVCWCEQCINPIRLSYVYPVEGECKDKIEHVRSLSNHQPVMGTYIFKD